MYIHLLPRMLHVLICFACVTASMGLDFSAFVHSHCDDVSSDDSLPQGRSQTDLVGIKLKLTPTNKKATSKNKNT